MSTRQIFALEAICFSCVDYSFLIQTVRIGFRALQICRLTKKPFAPFIEDSEVAFLPSSVVIEMSEQMI